MSEASDHDDNFVMSEETAEDMGMIVHFPKIAIGLFIVAGVLVYPFGEVFYAVLVASLAGLFGLLYKFGFLAVKAKQLFDEYVLGK